MRPKLLYCGSEPGGPPAPPAASAASSTLPVVRVATSWARSSRGSPVRGVERGVFSEHEDGGIDLVDPGRVAGAELFSDLVLKPPDVPDDSGLRRQRRRGAREEGGL